MGMIDLSKWYRAAERPVSKWPSMTLGEITGAIICFCLALLLSHVGFFTRPWEDLILSARFFGRGMIKYQEPVIVKIDEESLQAIGSWPWPRSIYADALYQLSQEEPAVVGLDLLFQEPDPENDFILAKALEEVKMPVVLGIELELEFVKRFWSNRLQVRGEKPALFPQADKGYLNLVQDADGRIRKWPLNVETTRFAFTERVYQLATMESPPAVGDGLIDFAGGADSFPSISFSKLIRGEYPEGFFRGKIVLVGVTASAMDRHDIAVQALGSVPGVYIHAYLIRNLLGQSWLRTLPDWLYTLILSGISLGWTAFLRKRVGRFLYLATFGMSVFAVILGVIVGFAGYVIQIVPLLGLFISELIFLLARTYRIELAERRSLRILFSKHVSPEILGEILKRRNEIKTGGERRFVTVVFADVRDFTRFAEEHEPEQVLFRINQLLGRMTAIILRNGGLVNKFLGDGLMAVFGFPVWKEEMFANAFAACREMLSAEEALAGKENGVGDRVGVRIGDGVGVGIAWGIVIAGIVGNQERQEYTVMGAPVNLASRLEKLAGPGEIVFSFEPGQTDRVIPFGEESYTLEQVHIKGMKQPITVGRIKGRG